MVPDFLSKECNRDFITRIGPIAFTDIVFSIESIELASNGDGMLIPAQFTTASKPFGNRASISFLSNFADEILLTSK